LFCILEFFLPEKTRRFDIIFQTEVTRQTSEDSLSYAHFDVGFWVVRAHNILRREVVLVGRIRTTSWKGRRPSRVSSIPSSMPSPIWQWAPSEPKSSSSSSPTLHTISIVTSVARISSLPKLHPTKPWSLCFPTTIKAPEIISPFSLIFLLGRIRGFPGGCLDIFLDARYVREREC